MSKPIAYATLALDEWFKARGVTLAPNLLDDVATIAVRGFLDDARREGRFDNSVISKLLDELR